MALLTLACCVVLAVRLRLPNPVLDLDAFRRRDELPFPDHRLVSVEGDADFRHCDRRHALLNLGPVAFRRGKDFQLLCLCRVHGLGFEHVFGFCSVFSGADWIS